LPVFDETKINGGLLFKDAVCNYGGNRIGNEVIERAMSGVFNLCDVFQFVIDRFYQSTFFLDFVTQKSLILQSADK
jgi:hypothetical protein